MISTGARYGDVDGHGRFGIVDETTDGLLCHECGHRYEHLGLHAYRAHGVTSAEYRRAHGLGRRGLVTEATREKIVANAKSSFERKASFVARRDPARATEARLQTEYVHSAAGLEAMRQTRVAANRARRLGTVVVCEWCAAEFCPLQGAKRRRFCSKSCASKYARRRGG